MGSEMCIRDSPPITAPVHSTVAAAFAATICPASGAITALAGKSVGATISPTLAAVYTAFAAPIGGITAPLASAFTALLKLLTAIARATLRAAFTPALRAAFAPALRAAFTPPLRASLAAPLATAVSATLGTSFAASILARLFEFAAGFSRRGVGRFDGFGWCDEGQCKCKGGKRTAPEKQGNVHEYASRLAVPPQAAGLISPDTSESLSPSLTDHLTFC